MCCVLLNAGYSTPFRLAFVWLAGANHCNSLQVLVEGQSRSGPSFLKGRTDGFQSVRIPADATVKTSLGGLPHFSRAPQSGDYVEVQVQERDGRLSGIPIRIMALSEFPGMSELTPSPTARLEYILQCRDESPLHSCHK